MGSKQAKKLKQVYRRDLRDQLEQVQIVKREETQILIDHLNHIIALKPKLIPKFVWVYIIKKLLYK